MTLITKTFEMKHVQISENELKGVASQMGCMDRAGDVIYPGFFKPLIKSFLQNGSVLQGHNSRDLPIAMPTEAKEDGMSLMTTAVFHGHQAAQDARNVIIERAMRNMPMGLSVGFIPDYDNDGVVWHENGKELLKYAKSIGYDTSDWDTKTINKWDGWCRSIVKGKELLEYSVTPIPMNPMAIATAKSIDPTSPNLTVREVEKTLREIGFSKTQAEIIISKGVRHMLGEQAADDTELQKDANTETPGEPVVDVEKAKQTYENNVARLELLRGRANKLGVA